MGYLDRIEIEFTSDVPSNVRDYLIGGVHERIGIVNETMPEYRDLYKYVSENRLNGAHRIEITAHDRTTFDPTDGQVVERLRVTAKDQGISVQELLRRLASDG
jgi:hypothetical protein